MPMAATTGCQSQQEKYNSMLSNAKIKDIESYSQLGYISKTSPSSKRNGRKNAYRTEKWSKTQFYLAGMIGDDVVGLDLSNGNSFWDVPISIFSDLGNFIGFSPEYSTDKESYDLKQVKGVGLDGDEIHETGDYLLSKKTGKIYKCNDYNEHLLQYVGLLSNSFINGEKVLYGFYQGEGDGYWAMITEENEQLAIKKSGMLNFLIDGHFLYQYGYYFDKYGNVLTGSDQLIGTIYGYDQKILTTNIEVDMPYGYEPFTNTIYTYHDSCFYVLDGLEFKKYDNIIFGYSFGDDGRYFYYADEQGKYKVGYDEKNASHSHNSIYQERVSSDGNTYFDVKEEESLYGAYEGIEGSKDSLTFYGNCCLVGGALYEKLGEYTYLKVLRDIPSCSSYVRRDQYMYYLEDYKFMKYNVIEDTTIEIDAQGYQIKTMSEDQYGNIVLTGYDSSFNEFTGYLSENDEVVFEPTNKGNAEYDVIYMNPIN